MNRQPSQPGREPLAGSPPDAPPPTEPATMESVYRDLHPGLVRLARLLTGSASVGEDVAHDAFVGLFRRFDTVDDPGAYLRRSVVNSAINRRRRAHYERRYLATLSETTIGPPQIDETWQALRRLPARQRAALVLRFYADLSEADTARTLGCRPGTVKSLTSRGLAALRHVLEEGRS